MKIGRATFTTRRPALTCNAKVPQEFKAVLDGPVVTSLTHHCPLALAEAALTLLTLAEVDPSYAGGLSSYAVTTLNTEKENVAFEKGSNLNIKLEFLHGEAALLAALLSISSKFPLGYPSRLPRSVLELSKKVLMESSRNPAVAAVEKEAGWTLLPSLLSSIPKEECEDQVFYILSMWPALFNGNQDIKHGETLNYSISLYEKGEKDDLLQLWRKFWNME